MLPGSRSLSTANREASSNPHVGSNRGILFPLLFLLSMDVLSRGIAGLVRSGKMDKFSSPRLCRPVSHTAFADDFTIFSSARRESVSNFAGLLNTFLEASSLSLNLSKSLVIHGKLTPKALVRSTKSILSFKRAQLPLMHLGCALDKGRLKSIHFQPLLEKMARRIASWKNRLLSKGGKKVLINSVLTSMSAYVSAVLQPPRSIVKSIERLLSRFLWGGNDNSARHHWAAWKRIAKPIAGGGMGIRDLASQVMAHSAKLWWRLFNVKSPWTDFIRSSYIDNRDGIRISSGDSPGWRRLASFHLRWKALAAWDDDPGEETRTSALLHRIRSSCCTVNRFEPNRAYIFFNNLLLPPVQISFKNDLLWHRLIPEKVSIFLWRLHHDALPFPTTLHRIGITLVSKCPFCNNLDDPDHLFWSCSISRPIWRWFESKLEISPSTPPFGFAKWWALKPKISSLAFTIPAYVCWSVWKAWNAATIAGQTISVNDLFWETQLLLRRAYMTRNRKDNMLENYSLSLLALF
ncbi:hypothetical protein HPP92_015854 [Vanilla planifolia]|uniref:Reverse transcriptase zinc-binding domain-containing protein n=1 Tax=Vanilla planifolia TaxID=51239 RepID=A0A835URJ0_VANPL|nr:hypothetical protein HPP92_015854 [Vanilla planifolia]